MDTENTARILVPSLRQIPLAQPRRRAKSTWFEQNRRFQQGWRCGLEILRIKSTWAGASKQLVALLQCRSMRHFHSWEWFANRCINPQPETRPQKTLLRLPGVQIVAEWARRLMVEGSHRVQKLRKQQKCDIKSWSGRRPRDKKASNSKLPKDGLTVVRGWTTAEARCGVPKPDRFELFAPLHTAILYKNAHSNAIEECRQTWTVVLGLNV